MPYVIELVVDGAWLPQDTTNHPAWTGEENGISSEDEHLSKFMRKYGAHMQNLSECAEPNLSLLKQI